MSNILCLDLGTTTGWACRVDGKITSGSVSFKPSRFDGGGMRFLKFRHWLSDMKVVMQGSIDSVFYEEVRRHIGTDAAHTYGGFWGTLTAWCESQQIPYQGIPVGTIKKHATGKGNATKADMILSARNRGHFPEDDNQADALALFYWASEAIDRD